MGTTLKGFLKQLLLFGVVFVLRLCIEVYQLPILPPFSWYFNTLILSVGVDYLLTFVSLKMKVDVASGSDFHHALTLRL